jgi:hypothetical protein
MEPEMMKNPSKVMLTVLALFLPYTAVLAAEPIVFYIDDVQIFHNGSFQTEQTREARAKFLGEEAKIQFLASGKMIRLLDETDDAILCDRKSRGVLAEKYVCDFPFHYTITLKKAGAYVHGAVMDYLGPTGWEGDSHYSITTHFKRR